MIFGYPETIAIEVGDVVSLSDGSLCTAFRFLIANQQFGNFDDRISLFGSAAGMKALLATREYRKNHALENSDAERVFAETFTAFYEYDDYSSQLVIHPNLRDRYHLNEVGMGSTLDVFGIVVVEVNSTTSRVVVKDLRTNRLVVDARISTKEIEEMGANFIEWAEQQLAARSEGDREVDKEGTR